MNSYSDDWGGYCDMRADAEELRRDEIQLAHDGAATDAPDAPILCDWHVCVVRDLRADAEVAAALARSCDDCEAAE